MLLIMNLSCGKYKNMKNFSSKLCTSLFVNLRNRYRCPEDAIREVQI